MEKKPKNTQEWLENLQKTVEKMKKKNKKKSNKKKVSE